MRMRYRSIPACGPLHARPSTPNRWNSFKSSTKPRRQRPIQPPRRPAGPHPLAALFIELWAARDEGSRVEVHLESGSVLVPDGYLKSHSMHDYAVLVTKDPDGARR